MKRRLNLITGLINDPDIILMDEPTVGIDPQSRNKIFDLIYKLREEEKTILYTTHYMEEANRLCDKIAIIDNGRIIIEGSPRELIDKYSLIGDVRGLGLYAGVELVTDRETQEPATPHADYVINRMRDHGILISTDGPSENVLKIKPPIVFTGKNADEVVDALDKILNEDCLQI